MKYPHEELKQKQQEESKTIDRQLGKLYNLSDSIEDFRVKADLEGLPKSKVLMLVAYYHIRQRKNLFRVLVVDVAIAIATLTFIGIEVVAQRIVPGGLGGYIGAIFAGLTFGGILGAGALIALNAFIEIIPNKFYYSDTLKS